MVGLGVGIGTIFREQSHSGDKATQFANSSGSQHRDSGWDLELASYVKSLLYGERLATPRVLFTSTDHCPASVTGGLTEPLAKAATTSLPSRVINIPSHFPSKTCGVQTDTEQVLSCKHDFSA